MDRKLRYFLYYWGKLHRLILLLFILTMPFIAIAISHHSKIHTLGGNNITTETISTSLPELENTFAKMTANGWKVKEPLVWGYYFYDRDEQKLTNFSVLLQRKGYVVKRLDNNLQTNDDLYLLYVEEKTINTPVSLLKKCQTLSNLAIENHIEIFDGWEVGRTQKNSESTKTI